MLPLPLQAAAATSGARRRLRRRFGRVLLLVPSACVACGVLALALRRGGPPGGCGFVASGDALEGAGDGGADGGSGGGADGKGGSAAETAAEIAAQTAAGIAAATAAEIAAEGEAESEAERLQDDADDRAFLTKLISAAAQGATAAAVAALLSAFTEPVVNRLLVQRMTVKAAIKDVKVQDCLRFFLTTFPTNMLKFPVFEVINTGLSSTSLSVALRGVVSGAIICTLALPLTNYRFRVSMNLPFKASLLYQAYPPTLLRDITYGLTRVVLGDLSFKAAPGVCSSHLGRCLLFGLTIWAACIASSPFNELRGYWLQPSETKLSLGAFFKPSRYVRSTSIGATIMGVSLAVGMLVTPLAESAFLCSCRHKHMLGVVLACGCVVAGATRGKAR